MNSGQLPLSILDPLGCATRFTNPRPAVIAHSTTAASPGPREDRSEVSLPSLKRPELSTEPFGPDGPACLLSRCRFPSLGSFYFRVGAHLKPNRSFRDAVEWLGPSLTTLALAYREVPAEEAVTPRGARTFSSFGDAGCRRSAQPSGAGRWGPWSRLQSALAPSLRSRMWGCHSRSSHSKEQRCSSSTPEATVLPVARTRTILRQSCCNLLLQRNSSLYT